MIERYRAKSQFGHEVFGLSICFFSSSRKDAIPINRDAKVFCDFATLRETKSFRVVIKNLSGNEFYLFVVTDCTRAKRLPKEIRAIGLED
jgi:hypothetical protein